MAIKLPRPYPDPATGIWDDDSITRNFQYLAKHITFVMSGTNQPMGTPVLINSIRTDQLVPSGAVIMLRSGSVCPAGYTKVTTGIAGKFIRLTTGTAGGSGGSTSASVGDSGHTHGVGSLATGSAGAHNHNVDPPATNTGTPSSTATVQSGTGTTVASSTHLHSVNLTTLTVNSTGAHTHTVTGNTTSATTGITVTIDPPYFEFILCEKT